MTCVSCEMVIKDELDNMNEVDQVTVCHKKKTAKISVKDDNLDIQKVIKKIKELGYTASLEKGIQNREKKQLYHSGYMPY